MKITSKNRLQFFRSWYHGPEHLKTATPSQNTTTTPQGCTTPKSTSSRAGCWHQHKNTTTKTPPQHEFSGRMLTTPPPPPQKHHHMHSMCEHSMRVRTPKSTKITTKNEHQFVGRMLQNTEKQENYHEKWTSVLGPHVAELKSTRITTKNRLQFLGRMLQRQKRQKSTSFIVKAPFKSIGEHRKVRELPRKMNIEEVEEPKKYEILQTKPVLDPFKSTADTRKVRELPRKMNIEEVEEPETTKIYRQNPRASARPSRKLREFTDETNMQARNHENSDEICAQPVRHLDLATPAFYYYRKNPKCYHTVWGICVLLGQGDWWTLSVNALTISAESFAGRRVRHTFGEIIHSGMLEATTKNSSVSFLLLFASVLHSKITSPHQNGELIRCAKSHAGAEQPATQLF